MPHLFNFLPALALACCVGTAQAQTAPAATMAKPAKTAKMAQPAHDHYMMHDGKMVMVKSGKSSPLTATATLPNGTQVMTDGTVTMKGGYKMTLKEGQEIGNDGKMHADDRDHATLHGTAQGGAMEHDHMLMHDGKMVMVKSGKSSPLTATATLPNGTQVMANGTVTRKNGQKMVLKEGQEIGTDGQVHLGNDDHARLHAAQKRGAKK